MKVLLIGNDSVALEQRRSALAENGFDTVAVSSREAKGHITAPDFGCVILGSSLDEELAVELADLFTLSGSYRRFVIRVAAHPVASDYPYAQIVVNPANPTALVAAVGALEKRHQR